MRRTVAVVTALLVTLLAACSSGTPTAGASKGPELLYRVTYQVNTGTTGSTIEADYTDGTGRQQKASTSAPLWTQELTITSAIPRITLSATLSGGFSQSDTATCIIQINGQTVASHHGQVACVSDFALGSYVPSPSPSPSTYSLPPAAPTVPRTRDAECRYASDDEVSTVVSQHMGGAQTVLYAGAYVGGCAYHFTNDVSVNDVVITYWRGTVLPKGGVSVSGLGGRATWDADTLNVQRSGGVVTVNVVLPNEGDINKDIGIALYKLVRGRIK